MMRKGRSDGGVTQHAIDRLYDQYGFKGSVKEARHLLRVCKKIVNKFDDRARISSRHIGISRKQLENWGIVDGKLVAIVAGNKVVTVID